MSNWMTSSLFRCRILL